MKRAHRVSTFSWAIMCLFLFKPVHAQQLADGFQPESTSQVTPKQARHAKEFMVVSAHPLATEAGYKILAQGGHAADAMVVIQTVLGLVEPQSSGLGGGAFALYYHAKNKTLTSFDARETAPMQANPALFLNENGEPMGFFEAVVGGRSVGTPGTVKLLWDMHQQYGNITWPDLLAPATQLASEGFNVSPRMADSIQKDMSRLQGDAETYAYFAPEGQPLQAGQRLRNPAYAQTLATLAKHGETGFYHGELAERIVRKVRQSDNPGTLTVEDFEAYRVIERAPVCAPYRTYSVCGMGPPSSGAHTVGQILGILNEFDLTRYAPDSPEAWHLIAEASRLAFADRGRYLADPDFISIPNGLLAPAYLKHRATMIDRAQAMPTVTAGHPPGSDTALITGRTLEQNSTTHFVIVDKAGNILSVTSTIENAFGSRLMVGGFLLNNELTDFSFRPSDAQGDIANRVAAGKRPRSSMAPTIVFKHDQPFLALGSPGGSRIINYVANTLVRVLDWQMSLQSSINAPHLTSRFGVLDLEANTPFSALEKDLAKMGHKVSIRDLNSGLHGVHFTPKGMIGAADPRREGMARGH